MAEADTLDFKSSFRDSASPATVDPRQELIHVEGVVHGRQDNAAGPAVGVEITYSSGSHGVGTYDFGSSGDPRFNIWTVADGAVTRANAVSWGQDNTSPDVTCCTLGGATFNLSTSLIAGALTGSPRSVVFSMRCQATFTPLAEVPLPRAVLALAAALRMLGAPCSRRAFRSRVGLAGP
ncbi:hypothetical protein [Mangrovicoccus ximenensis]|uniref:hypothetical protein n=1 Tax=Mangrovicoccus ximenensis TaxID=1911570 RepID=UPI000D3609BF|nr:hypothetical protein [Mangrovicoccus ximenensis]